MFGNYDFGLNEEQEQRAAALHRESIIVDTLFQGPCGYRSFTDEMVQTLKDDFEKHRSVERGLWDAVLMPIRGAIKGEFPDFEACWRDSGITAGNRQAGGSNAEEALQLLQSNLHDA